MQLPHSGRGEASAEGTAVSLRRALTIALLFLLAGVGAILTAIGQIPRLAGWSAVLVVAVGALSSVFYSPLSAWINKAVSSRFDRTEKIESLRRTGTAIVREVDDLDPVLDLGVHPSPDLANGPALTPYVSRDIDIALDQALPEGGLIVIEGDSTAGKTRTAYEAIRRASTVAQPLRVLIPKDGITVRELVEAGFEFQNIVLWLDDLERFLFPEGIDDGLLSMLLSRKHRKLLIVATIRSRAKSALGINAARPDTHNFGFDARRIFAFANTFRLQRFLTAEEFDSATKYRHDARIADALDTASTVGFAEHLASGPTLLGRWEMGRQGANPVGAALVSAAVDYHRAGYLGSVPGLWLDEVYSSYLDPHTLARTTAADLQDGYKWATQAVHGASSCLIPCGEETYSAAGPSSGSGRSRN